MANDIQQKLESSDKDVRGIESVINEMIIDSVEMAEVGANMIRQLKATRDSVEETRFSITRPMDEAKKRTIDLFRPLIERCDAGERVLREKVSAFMAVQKARAAAENERRHAEAAATAEMLLQHAKEAAEAGDATESAALQTIAEVSRSAVSEVRAAAPAGVGGRENWKFELEDLDALIEAAAKDKTLRPLLVLDTKETGRRVRALRGNTNIPGVRVWNADSITIR